MHFPCTMLTNFFGQYTRSVPNLALKSSKRYFHIWDTHDDTVKLSLWLRALVHRCTQDLQDLHTKGENSLCATYWQRIHTRIPCIQLLLTPTRWRCILLYFQIHYLEVMFPVDLLCQCSVCLAQDNSLNSWEYHHFFQGFQKDLFTWFAHSSLGYEERDSSFFPILLIVWYKFNDLLTKNAAISFKRPVKQEDRGVSTPYCSGASRLERGGR